MIKVMGLPLYGPLAASTRVRLGQFQEGLVGHGIDLQLFPLLTDEYVRQKFNGASLPWRAMARSAWQRFRLLQSAERFDLAILYCEVFPLMPARLERTLLRTPYIYDLDDAFYLRYRIGRQRMLSGILGSKFDDLLAGASAVFAGNETLAAYSRQHSATVQLFPTVVDTNWYLPIVKKGRRTFTVGWIGSPSTSTYLPQIVGPLSELGKEGAVEFVVVGGKAPVIPHVTVKEVPWSERTEVKWISSFDVGVMPLPDDEWARGKCAFKLIQYMACGLPVVGSAVGANNEVVTPECGFLVSSPQEWLAALRRLRDDPSLRRVMGEASRQRVEQHYSLQGALPRMAAAIQRIAGK